MSEVYSHIPNPLQSATNWHQPFTYNDVITGFQGWQGGGMIPKTGLYKLHEGERVSSKNSSLNMGGITINVPRGTSKQQAMEVVNELKKALKYKQVEIN